MHITFVHNNYESLGIEYISSYLKTAGHKTSLVFEPGLFGSFFANSERLHKLFNFKQEIIHTVINLRPDIVAFSVISDNYAWACELAQEIKNKLDVYVVFGGTHPTSVPERVAKEKSADFIIIGEGEETFLELVDSLEKGKQWENIRNLTFKKNGNIVVNPLRPPIRELDSLPFPDKDLFFKEYNNLINSAYMIITSRGCMYSCSYCINSVLNRIYSNLSYFRKRSVNNVIDELKWAKQRYNIKKVTFYDEIFTIDKMWLKQFLVIYRDEINLPFFCCVHPSNLDGETVELLINANCTTVNIGIQTFSEDFRKRILNRSGNNEEIILALRLFRRTKIFVYANVMLGLPTQSEEDLLKTWEFCTLNKSDLASIYWLRYYPKTTIINIASKLGVLSRDDINNIEMSKKYTPYAIKGNTFNKKTSKIGNLISLSSITPVFLTKFIIKSKCYNWMPSKNLLFTAIAVIGLFKKIIRGKKEPFHYFNIFDYLKFYFFYIKKKFLISKR